MWQINKTWLPIVLYIEHLNCKHKILCVNNKYWNLCLFNVEKTFFVLFLPLLWGSDENSCKSAKDIYVNSVISELCVCLLLYSFMLKLEINVKKKSI